MKVRRRQDEEELVAANATRDIPPGVGAARHRRYLPQDVIAGVVAVGIIHGLEVVQVCHGQTEAGAMASGPGALGGGGLVKVTTVRNAAEVVDAGQVMLDLHAGLELLSVAFRLLAGPLQLLP